MPWRSGFSRPHTKGSEWARQARLMALRRRAGVGPPMLGRPARLRNAAGPYSPPGCTPAAWRRSRTLRGAARGERLRRRDGGPATLSGGPQERGHGQPRGAADAPLQRMCSACLLYWATTGALEKHGHAAQVNERRPLQRDQRLSCDGEARHLRRRHISAQHAHLLGRPERPAQLTWRRFSSRRFAGRPCARRCGFPARGAGEHQRIASWPAPPRRRSRVTPAVLPARPAAAQRSV